MIIQGKKRLTQLEALALPYHSSILSGQPLANHQAGQVVQVPGHFLHGQPSFGGIQLGGVHCSLRAPYTSCFCSFPFTGATHQ